MSNLHVDSVVKSYGSKRVLSDIYLSCSKGEIVGLLGRNGSGKSTLLKIIFGSLAAEGKFIKVDGKLVDGVFDNRNMVSYLPQNSFLPNHIKVSTIIGLFCDRHNAKIVSENLLVKPFLSKRSRQLSGGEKRIVEVLLIVHSTAQYILIDEPFNGIAPVYKEAIKELIREQSKTKGFIVTDHDYRNVLDLSTRTMLIHNGGTIAISSKEQLALLGYIPQTAVDEQI